MGNKSGFVNGTLRFIVHEYKDCKAKHAVQMNTLIGFDAVDGTSYYHSLDAAKVAAARKLAGAVRHLKRLVDKGGA